MRNRVTWLEIVILAVIVAAAGILCGIWASNYYRKQKPKNEENAAYFSSVYAEKQNDFTNTSDDKNQQSQNQNVVIDTSADSAYKKLQNGERINVLVLGDETCTGYGSSDGSWIGSLSEELYSKYGSSVYVTNLAYNYATALIQYYEVKALDNNVEYDLILISVGANDVRTESNTKFDSQYEALVRIAKSEYPNAEIITVVQSTENEQSVKAETIKAVSEHYNADYVDMVSAYAEALANVDTEAEETDEEADALTYDGVFPNEAGYELYVTETLAVIDNCVSASKKTTEFPEILFEETDTYETYQYISFSSMSEISPGVYQTTIKKDFDAFSLLYTLNSEGGVYRLYVNDYEYKYEDTKWTQSSERKKILTFTNGFTDTTKIRIEVEDTANKPKIHGIILNGIAE